MNLKGRGATAMNLRVSVSDENCACDMEIQPPLDQCSHRNLYRSHSSSSAVMAVDLPVQQPPLAHGLDYEGHIQYHSHD